MYGKQCRAGNARVWIAIGESAAEFAAATER
jgi:hypothetical protein